MAVEPKRRRSDPALSFGCSSISRKRPVPRDIYDEIQRPSGSTAAAVVVHSSWLTTVQWISSSTCSQLQLPTGAQGDNEEDASDADAAVSLAQEIQTLTRQLLQVKRRLGPAAERLAQARNDANHDETTTTTAHWEFERARRACNPMEALGQAGGGRDRHRQRGLNHRLFMNRSAIKLANLDAAILDFGLTTKATSTEEETFVFVDLCGAPGGFSEYVLWRCCQCFNNYNNNNNKTTCCLGYGMSLMGSNEQGSGLSWKLHDQTYHSKVNANHLYHHNGRSVYVQYRVCSGSDGTGDIYNWNNVEHLQQTILRDTAANRVPPLQQQQQQQPTGQAHVVLADGGFDSQRDAENQEEVAQKLVVCEVAAALSLLRRGGTLVLKTFGAQTTVVRAVMRHLFFCFDGFVLVKPISSRPASAERYSVCTGFHGNPTGSEGSRWCSQMLLGQNCSLSNFQATVPDYDCANLVLLRYLNEFDRDMLDLNLKACFAILSYLENKSQESFRRIQNTAVDDNDDDYDEDETIEDEAPRVNIASYKYAWRLE